jgi:hypothetical protein
MRRLVWFTVTVVGLGVLTMFIIGRGSLIGSLTENRALKESQLRVLELNSRGVDLLNAREVDEALTLLEEAARLAPDDQMVQRNLSLAVSRKGGQVADGGAPGKAVQYYERSLELWDANPEALELLAILEYENGNYSRAREYARRLADIYPARQDIQKFMASIESNLVETAGMVAEKGQYFRLLYSGQKQLQFEGELLSMLQTEMDSLTSSLGVFPRSAIDVLILTGDLGARADQFDPLVEGLYDGRIRLYYDAITNGGSDLKKTVRHEMVHALVHRAAGNDLPAWFQEGVAQKVGEDPSPGELAELAGRLRRAMQYGLIVDLNAMQHTFITLGEKERGEAYAISLLFVDHLTERYGDRIIPVLLLEMGGGVGVEAALAGYTGKQLMELQNEFIITLGAGG